MTYGITPIEPIRYSEWHESPQTGGRYREVYGPFDCETDCADGVVYYCDDCGDCMACDLGQRCYVGGSGEHRAIQYEDARTRGDL